ncbi:flagellar protein [Rhizobium sp. CC-YZS058]|uniref:flagellar protein n=1 Tax=Rhizobium sp. CC-YZS058 TaxID=3042153 RepID=UPI002B05F73F|nr:flagellar protein [Rhizobium sp. CC-YZS058]MEA3536066.1 flagellar protein [Rhizobium sp. CC-YZS058]
MKQTRFDERDADEIVRQPRLKDRTPMIDRALIATGVALAGLATFFPWYAFLNQDKFAMPSLWQGQTRDLSQKIGHDEATASPLDGQMDEETKALFDQLMTASTPAKAAPSSPSDGQDQPFPGTAGFKLVHVASGRALIEDANGLYIVKVGSPLPDNSRLATLEERDGGWVLVTSKGEVFRAP